MAVQPVNWPQGPMVQKDGTLTHQWQRFFQDQWRKQGGPTNLAPIDVSGTAENIVGLLTSLHLVNNSQLNTTNFCTVDSVDNGTSATIRVYGIAGVGNGWNRQVGNFIVPTSPNLYPAMSQAGAAYATDYYVVFDPDARVFTITTSFSAALADNLIFCGKITTVAMGGGGGSTGGGGTDGGPGGVCFSGNTKVKTHTGPKQFYVLPTYPVLMTEFGPREAKLEISAYEGPVHHMGDDEWVTPKHPFKRNGLWVPADEIFKETKHFSGHVYNAHILTDKEEERHYILENGETVHNMSMG